MKKAFIGAMLFALAMTPVLAGADVTTHAEIWNRYENVSNFLDFTDTTSGGGSDDSFDFGVYRVRAGMGVEFDENITGMIEFQNFGTWGNSFVPSNAQDPISGAVDARGLTDSNVELYQAWVKLANIAGSNFSLTFGRQEHTLGNELHIGDSDFYSGQYFDGLRGVFDFESWELNLFYYLVKERNILPGSLEGEGPVNGGHDDVTFFGAHANFDINDANSIEPYVLVYKDSNEFGSVFGPKMDTTTIGALYQFDSDDSQFDGSFEYAFQTGEQGPNGNTDISSWVAEGAFGYDFNGDEDGQNRLGIGLAIWADGDDPSDNEAFQELFTDSHRRFGLLDLFSSQLSTGGLGVGGGGDTLHNLQDININWAWNNGTHGFGAAYHMFTCFEENNCGGDDDLGTEIDLRYNFNHGEHFGVEVVAAMFEPGDTFGTADDSVMRIYAMGKVRK
jgi:hypothetical protein